MREATKAASIVRRRFQLHKPLRESWLERLQYPLPESAHSCANPESRAKPHLPLRRDQGEFLPKSPARGHRPEVEHGVRPPSSTMARSPPLQPFPLPLLSRPGATELSNSPPVSCRRESLSPAENPPPESAQQVRVQLQNLRVCEHPQIHPKDCAPRILHSAFAGFPEHQSLRHHR